VRRAARPVVPPDVAEAAARIVSDVKSRGEAALRDHAEALDGLAPGAPLWAGRDELAEAWGQAAQALREALERAADRIRAFAEAQRASLADLDMAVPGGRAGHRFLPVATAGCYVPGGRHPLPSSALMTCLAAKCAGVTTVVAATPRPHPVTLAALHAAGADGALLAGGAHAVAALAYGVAGPRCDVVAGPGNAWVTAAKKAVFGDVGIDMLAGPSEVAVLADESADPAFVAADLLAQAEHDVLAEAWLVTAAPEIGGAVEAEVERRLAYLPTAETARAALANGAFVECDSLDQALEVVDALAPEHLELHVTDPVSVLGRVKHFGSAFLGRASAEVFGDYGAGPNHTLPTGGTARFSSGLSVLHFLRCQTWVCLEDPGPLVADSALLARAEGLEAHARAAEARQAWPQ
jgi:phosphoribosyl-ATP pyrophosphohydrolase/phosphoribosyl-AMP cyclohydrolase/histidinol dehydrogenase